MMNLKIRDHFIAQWKKYFGEAELPITFYYSDQKHTQDLVAAKKGRSCFICDLGPVRRGKNLVFNHSSLACGGARRYLGYTDTLRPDFEYFLSCGIPGELEGERYKRTPEMVKLLMKHHQVIPANDRNIVFKRWDQLTEKDTPEVVIFFAKPDVLSGLFTLANFDQVDPNGGAITPFAAGCGSIVHYPYLEIDQENPRAVIGMFDTSARPCVSENILTFAVPFRRFERMISYMDESFLITDTWNTMFKRINRS
ncbi:MAG: DUF169 domain-containing protein [Bacteroidales bacterium]|jgi:hypothetical protein|nr:DUF169 domain-containing protein [Bacteroidales bacterium]